MQRWSLVVAPKTCFNDYISIIICKEFGQKCSARENKTGLWWCCHFVVLTLHKPKKRVHSFVFQFLPHHLMARLDLISIPSSWLDLFFRMYSMSGRNSFHAYDIVTNWVVPVSWDLQQQASKCQWQAWWHKKVFVLASPWCKKKYHSNDYIHWKRTQFADCMAQKQYTRLWRKPVLHLEIMELASLSLTESSKPQKTGSWNDEAQRFANGCRRNARSCKLESVSSLCWMMTQSHKR